MKQALAGDGLYEKLTRAFILIFIQSSLSKQVHESMKKKIAKDMADPKNGTYERKFREIFDSKFERLAKAEAEKDFKIIMEMIKA